MALPINWANVKSLNVFGSNVRLLKYYNDARIWAEPLGPAVLKTSMTGEPIKVKRTKTWSPYGFTGDLKNGDMIYYYDELTASLANTNPVYDIDKAEIFIKAENAGSGTTDWGDENFGVSVKEQSYNISSDCDRTSRVYTTVYFGTTHIGLNPNSPGMYNGTIYIKDFVKGTSIYDGSTFSDKQALHEYKYQNHRLTWNSAKFITYPGTINGLEDGSLSSFPFKALFTVYFYSGYTQMTFLDDGNYPWETVSSDSYCEINFNYTYITSDGEGSSSKSGEDVLLTRGSRFTFEGSGDYSVRVRIQAPLNWGDLNGHEYSITIGTLEWEHIFEPEPEPDTTTTTTS